MYSLRLCNFSACQKLELSCFEQDPSRLDAAFLQKAWTWPLPEMYHLMQAFLHSRGHADAKFEANICSIETAFLKDHKVMGKSTLQAFALLEMVMEGARMLSLPLMTKHTTLQSITVGTVKEITPSSRLLSCTVDTTLGEASINDSSWSLFKANIVQHRAPFASFGDVKGVENMKKSQHDITHLLLALVPIIKTHARCVFSTAKLDKESSGYIVHPALLQTLLTTPSALYAKGDRASYQMASCAAVTITTSDKAHSELFGANLCGDKAHLRRRVQHLRYTSAQGLATGQLIAMQPQKGLEAHENGTMHAPPALALQWQSFQPNQQKRETSQLPMKLLVLSQAPCKIADLCNISDQTIIGTSVIFNALATAKHGELHINNRDDLLLLLSGMEADHCLIVQNDEPYNRMTISSSEDAMLWLFRAFAMAFAKTLVDIKLNLLYISNRMEYVSSRFALCQGGPFHPFLCLCTFASKD